MAAYAAIPFFGERMRAAHDTTFHVTRSLLFIQGFKIQIQGQNLHSGSVAYGTKSETMGGLGEKLGDER